MNFSLFGQGSADKVQVTADEYAGFPGNFEVLMKVLEHYQGHVLGDQAPQTNETQQALVYYYLVDGMINNSGALAILIESFGEYNDGYLKALKLSDNQSDWANYNELVRIFKKYEDTFMDQELPAALDDEEEDYNEAESQLLDDIEEKWYDNTEPRDQKFARFLIDRKADLLEVKE